MGTGGDSRLEKGSRSSWIESSCYVKPGQPVQAWKMAVN